MSEPSKAARDAGIRISGAPGWTAAAENAADEIQRAIDTAVAELERKLSAARLTINVQRDHIDHLKSHEMRDESQDGIKYRRMRRVMLDILHALGDPETSVHNFNCMVEQEDFYEVCMSYITPLIEAKEAKG